MHTVPSHHMYNLSIQIQNQSIQIQYTQHKCTAQENRGRSRAGSGARAAAGRLGALDPAAGASAVLRAREQTSASARTGEARGWQRSGEVFG